MSRIKALSSFLLALVALLLPSVAPAQNLFQRGSSLNSWSTATLDIDFTTGTLDPRLTFTRASTATRFNALGQMELVASGAPRFNYTGAGAPRGILLEDLRTNLLLNSLLDGTPLVTQSIAVTGGTHTLSFYGTGSITLSGAATGTLTGTGAFPSRSTLTFSPSTGTLTLSVSGTVQYAQLEVGVSDSSFIPTAGTAVTRQPDLLLMSGSAFSSWYNTGAGVFVFDLDYLPATTAQTNLIFAASDGSITNRVQASLNKGTAVVTATITTGGALQATFSPGSVTGPNVGQTLALGYALNDYAGAVNNSSPVTAASGPPPTAIDRINIGSNAVSLPGAGLHVKRFSYYPTKPLNFIVQGLSSRTAP